jgi:hypothetical protein
LFSPILLLVSLIATLGVVEDSEELAGLLNANNVHNAEGETWVSSDFVVNLDQSFLILNDLHGLLAGECVVESVSEKDAQGDALAASVGAGRWSGSVDTTELVQHPVGGSCHSLLMLLGSSRLIKSGDESNCLSNKAKWCLGEKERGLDSMKLTIFSAKIYINNK